MKTHKTRKLVLLSFIGVLCVIFVLQLVAGARNSVRTLTLNEKPDTILIVKPDGTNIQIVKNGDKWIIGDRKYPADSSKINAMVSALETVKVLGTVSKNSDDERYGLVKTAGISVSAIKDGKTLRKLTIGKESVTAEQAYINLDDGKDVLLVTGSLKDTFDKTVGDIRDKGIFSLDADSLTKISVTGSTEANDNWVLEKAGDPPLWTLTSDSTPVVDAEKAANWVKSLVSLDAADFAPENIALPATTLGKISFTEGGKDVSLTVYEKSSDKQYLCSSSENQYPFYLTPYVAEKYLKKITDLAK